jgi:hypothetical protein
LNLEASEINNKMDQLSPPARFGEDYYLTLAVPSSIRVFLHTKATELEPNPRSSVQKVRVATLTGNIFSVVPIVVVLATGGIDRSVGAKKTSSGGILWMIR